MLLAPYLVMVLTALKPAAELRTTPPRLFPVDWRIGSFAEVLGDAAFQGWLRASLIVAVTSTALAVAAAVRWIANFVVSTTFPPLVAALGLEVVYGAYTAAAALSFFFVLFLIPETKGRELEDID